MNRPVTVPTDDPLVRRASAVIGGPLGRHARLEVEPWGPVPNPVAVDLDAAPGGIVPGRRAPLRQVLRRRLGEPPDLPAGVYPPRAATPVQRARSSLPVLVWPPVAAVLSLVASGMLILGVIEKAPCFRAGWSVPDAFWRACYADMPFLLSDTALGSGGMPYPTAGTGGQGLTQPVGTGVAMWLTSLLIPPWVEPATRPVWYMAVWTGVVAIMLVLLVVLTAWTARRDPWRAAHVALSPLLVTVALVSTDLLGVVLLAWGMFLWAREHPTAAGVVIGLAAATRTYPIVIPVVLLFLAIRAGRLRPALRTLVTALGTWGGVLLIAGLLTGGSALAAYRAWAGAQARYGSLGFLTTLAGVDLPAGVMTAVSVLGWSAALLVGAVLALMPSRRPLVAEVCLVVLAVVLVSGKSVPVQSSLWLLPFVALAGLRWREHMAWAATEVLYFIAVWLHLGGTFDANRGLPLPWYAAFTLLRDAGILSLVWVVFRRARARPAAGPHISTEDQIRDDPDDLAGPLTGAHDALVVAVQ